MTIIGTQRKTKHNDEIFISFVDELASESVTGSMVYIETPKHKILLDAGFHQTNDLKNDYLANTRRFLDFKPKDIDFIFLSHNHGDHIFESPVLYKKGCTATTFIPENTKGILTAMMNDCLYINDRDAKWLREKYGKNYQPIFDEKDLNKFLNHTEESIIKRKIQIDEELSFQFIPSGHLKGGCQILLYITIRNCTKKILYTGDLGNPLLPQPFTEKFEPVKKANIVIGESTYASKKDLKIDKKTRDFELEKLKNIIIEQVQEKKGKVIIPVFAQQRAQNIAYFIYEAFKKVKDFSYKVYIDSPLACEIFRLYNLSLSGKDKLLMEELMNWKNLEFIKEGLDSKALIESNEPCIILSSSGMCNHGRVKNHIKNIISDKNATILFCGYSADGTLASLLKDASRNSIIIDSEEYEVCCNCYSFITMSSHMPYDGLLNYYSNIHCEQIVLHHGNMDGKMEIRKDLKKEYEKQFKTTKIIISDKNTRLFIK